MTRLSAWLAVAFAAAAGPPVLPCVYWPHSPMDTRAVVRTAGLERLCVPPELAGVWRAAGIETISTDSGELSSRQALRAPGIAQQVDLVSATRSPWLDANGWRFLREPAGRYRYELAPGRGALAAAEASAYRADAILAVDAADLPEVGRILSFVNQLPQRASLQPVADVGVVDDGSDEIAEVMTLLSRRNLLFAIVQSPAPGYRVNVVLGDNGYARDEAADPYGLALKIRRRLTDEARTVRIYGSEVVLCHVTRDAAGIRLHLLNYGGRDIQGLRVRLRGTYRGQEARVAGLGTVPLEDVTLVDGTTEFSIPQLTVYGVVDLIRDR